MVNPPVSNLQQAFNSYRYLLVMSGHLNAIACSGADTEALRGDGWISQHRMNMADSRLFLSMKQVLQAWRVSRGPRRGLGLLELCGSNLHSKTTIFWSCTEAIFRMRTSQLEESHGPLSCWACFHLLSWKRWDRLIRSCCIQWWIAMLDLFVSILMEKTEYIDFIKSHKTVFSFQRLGRDHSLPSGQSWSFKIVSSRSSCRPPSPSLVEAFVVGENHCLGRVSFGWCMYWSVWKYEYVAVPVVYIPVLLPHHCCAFPIMLMSTWWSKITIMSVLQSSVKIILDNPNTYT